MALTLILSQLELSPSMKPRAAFVLVLEGAEKTWCEKVQHAEGQLWEEESMLTVKGVSARSGIVARGTKVQPSCN
eukprot:11291051-Ditylum_brightwellii.AAC.1